MLRWYGRRQERRRPRLIGCLIWLIALIVILIAASLLFGGFTKGTKASLSRPVAPLVSAGVSGLRAAPGASQRALA